MELYSSISLKLQDADVKFQLQKKLKSKLQNLSQPEVSQPVEIWDELKSVIQD